MTISTTTHDIVSFRTATRIGQIAGARAGMADCYVRPVDSGYAVFAHTQTGRMSVGLLRRTIDRLVHAGMTDVKFARDDTGGDHVAFRLPIKA